MDKATAERIFEPFYTTKKSGKGTGLGLASVQQITTSMVGFIRVESDLNTGSQFDIYLPLKVDRDLQKQ